MAWKIEFEATAKKELAKLDPQAARRILAFLRDRVGAAENPRLLGAALNGPRFGEFWRYRVGDHRIIARIEDERLLIMVVRIGDRKQVYR